MFVEECFSDINCFYLRIEITFHKHFVCGNDFNFLEKRKSLSMKTLSRFFYVETLLRTSNLPS